MGGDGREVRLYPVGYTPPGGVFRYTQWARDYHVTINGKRTRKRYRFGPIDEPLKAVLRWRAMRADLEAGRDPDTSKLDEAPRIITVANQWLDGVRLRVDSGTLAEKTYRQKVAVVVEWAIDEHVGRDTPTTHVDEALLRVMGRDLATKGLRTRGRYFTYFNEFVKYARKRGVRFGFVDYPDEFKPPTKAQLRRHDNLKDPERRYVQRVDLHRLLAACRPLHPWVDPWNPGEALEPLDVLEERRRWRLTAWILLGINAGFEPSMFGVLRARQIDLKRGIITASRSKTGVQRSCTLWPETALALSRALEPGIADHPSNPLGLAFLGRWREGVRRPVYYAMPSGNAHSAPSRMFGDLARRLKIQRGYGALRHTCYTIASRSLDRATRDKIVGHADASMAEHYLHEVEAERQRAVLEHVRRWLFFVPDGVPWKGYLGVINPLGAAALEEREREAVAGRIADGEALGMFVTG
jgi:integrase